jgi:hypothetical protein
MPRSSIFRYDTRLSSEIHCFLLLTHADEFVASLFRHGSLSSLRANNWNSSE